MAANTGAVMPMVLLFSLVAGILISVYLRNQYIHHRPYFRDHLSLQALLNARSGIYRGLEILAIQDTATEQPPEADSADFDLFGADLFETETSDTDTTIVLEPDDELPLTLYRSGESGDCVIRLEQDGMYQYLLAQGRYRNEQREIRVTLGARPFGSGDTVLYLETGSHPEGTGLIEGETALLAEQLDTAGLSARRFEVREQFSEYIRSIETTLSQSALDTSHESVPLSIEYSEDCPEIPEVVMGPLILDGSFHRIEWKEDRTIQVLGDLQINGEVHIEGVSFLVKGEIRLGVTEHQMQRDLTLKSVSLFSGGRIFLAHNVVFSGTALAQDDIEVYKNARVVDKAILISNGGRRKRPSQTTVPVGKTAGAPGTNSIAAAEQKAKKVTKKAKPFTIRVRDEAAIDGILINTTKRGGVYTDPETSLRGVVWGEGFVCHQGEMEGVILAHALVDSSNIVAGHNIMHGSLEPLPSVAEYHLPWFMSIRTVLYWEEQ